MAALTTSMPIQMAKMRAVMAPPTVAISFNTSAKAFRSGMDTFKKCDCALFCEFNPKLYQYNGRYDSFIADIKACFGRFICYEQSDPGKYQFRDIGELDKVAEENNMNQCNLLLVK